MSNKAAVVASAVILGVAAIAATLVLVLTKSDGQPPGWAKNTPAPAVVVATPTTFTATVSMEISLGYSSRCESGGYSDIRAGAQVQIVNQKNDVLAVGTLERPAPDACRFLAIVKDIPLGEAMYGAKLGNANRGVIWKTEAEARKDSWYLSLG